MTIRAVPSPLLVFRLCVLFHITHQTPLHVPNFMNDVLGVKGHQGNQGLPVLTATPATITSETQTVTVHWANMTYTKATDWIGVFAAGSEDQLVSPIKYRFASEGGKIPGSDGTVTFQLQNRRTAYIFAYITGGQQFPTILAKSNLVSYPAQDLIAPMQPRLSLVPGEAREMALTWTCKHPGTRPQWRVGTSPNNYDMIADAVVTTIKKEEFCDAGLGPASGVGFFDPGYFLTAIVKHLLPGTVYYYSFGDAELGWSPEYTFMGPPPPGYEAGPTVMIGFGDMGQAPSDGSLQHSWDFNNQGEIPSRNTSRTMSYLVDEAFKLTKNAFVMHIGDISYAVGFEFEWDQFMNMIAPISSRVPYMTGIGNHEEVYSKSFFTGADSGGECGVAYLARFPLVSPTVKPPSAQTPWYKFSYGLVTVVVMSTEHNFTRGSPQWNDLYEMLSTIDRYASPWVVFTGHRPMYADSTWRGDTMDSRMLQDALEDMLIEHKVNLALWGHVHMFTRTCPVHRGICVPDGKAPMHFIIGSAGYQLGKNTEPNKPEWVQGLGINNYGIGNFKFMNNKTAIVEWVSNTDHAVLDTVTITNQYL